MSDISSYDKLEEFGRVRLSSNFFMRDFLHSEIAAWHGLRNVPDHPEEAVLAGRQLCHQLLEPLQATFGRIHIRSGYRSPLVNDFGNKNKLNCSSNEANFAGHIWDYPDSRGKRGATACVVIPWLVDHIERGGHWQDMAWWIHDHLPYSSLCFFSKLAAFNITWHESPVRRIDSYALPKGCLTQPGMANHSGSHAGNYSEFPELTRASEPFAEVASAPGQQVTDDLGKRVDRVQTPMQTSREPSAQSPHISTATKARAGALVAYRAVHTRSGWRKVNSHKSLDSAILGKDGAAGLFARRVRIDYETHGDPLYVLVWEADAAKGYAIKGDAASPDGIRRVTVPIEILMGFERRGGASAQEIESLF
jgi:hypothetical protein